ncbi:MAG: cytochrome c oxidase subunit II [Alphaproteobacteria bacterium]|nr:MAG: cytochrome c oxidase subunit II [Alphaproteobacteria bacterium]
MRYSRIGATLAGGLTALAVSGAALAQDAEKLIGQPKPGGAGWQPPATELARDIHWLDGFVFTIITGICLLVGVLLLLVIFRFNARANPQPRKFTHNSVLEVSWTVGPIIILIVIGSLSLPILFKQLRVPDSDLTVKVTGKQWFWTYEYPDDGIEFDSNMIGNYATGGDMRLTDDVRQMLTDAGYTEKQFRLAADNALVVPVGKVVRLQITGEDVIHSWTVPSFGVKLDAVPGRLAETWFRADVEGVFFGQCSELCGKDHAFMPITVKVVSEAEYAAWLATAKEEFAAEAEIPAEPGPSVAEPVRLAAN